jgi:hypothetical protein
LSLHKYLYAQADPIGRVDPSGNFSIVEMSITNSVRSTLMNLSSLQGQAIISQLQHGGEAGLADIALGAILAVGVAAVARYMLPKVSAQIAQLMRGTSKERFFFRGTSVGYAGGAASQSLGRTSATINPAIAHMFAARSATHGAEGTVYVASNLDLQGATIVESNILGRLEKEVAFDLLPEQFASRAGMSITIEQSKDILGRMGINVPSRIYNNETMNEFIREVPQMTKEQIAEYVRLAKNVALSQ